MPKYLGGLIHKSLMYDDSVIMHDAILKNSILVGHAVVSGNISNIHVEDKANVTKNSDVLKMQSPMVPEYMVYMYNGTDGNRYVLDGTNEFLLSDYVSELVKEDERYARYFDYVNLYFEIQVDKSEKAVVEKEEFER